MDIVDENFSELKLIDVKKENKDCKKLFNRASRIFDKI